MNFLLLHMVLLAAPQECVPADVWVDYVWESPMDAAQETRWRQAIEAQDGKSAYEILKEHGRFINKEDERRNSKPLCDDDLKLYQVYRRLAVGAMLHVMPDAALAILDEAIKLDSPPGFSAALHLYRACLLSAPDPKAAIADAQKAIQLAPDWGGPHATMAFVLGGFVASEGVFRRLKNYKKILREIDLAVKLGADDADILTEAVGTYSYLPTAAGGDGRKALKYAKVIAAIDSSKGYLSMGRAYVRLGQLRLAIRQFSVALDQPNLLPDQAIQAGIGLAAAYVEMGRHEQAFETLFDLRAQFPEHSMPLYRIGSIAAVTRKRQREGIDALRKWLDHPAALSSAWIGCQFSPDFAYAHYRLGQLHDQLDEIEQARAEYNKALEYAPDLEEAELALRRLPK